MNVLNTQIQGLSLEKLISALDKIITTIKKIKDNFDLDYYDYKPGESPNSDNQHKENEAKSIEELHKIILVLIQDTDHSLVADLSKITKIEDIKKRHNDLLKFTDQLENILLKAVYEQSVSFFSPGPSIKTKETTKYEEIVHRLVSGSNGASTLMLDSSSFHLRYEETDLLDLMTSVNFRDLVFNISQADTVYEKTLAWLGESKATDKFTIETLKEKVKDTCPDELTKPEYLFLLLYTEFAFRDDNLETMSFCKIINRAFLDQDKPTQDRFRIFFGSLCGNDKNAQEAILSLLVVGAGLIGSTLSKMNKADNVSVAFRNTLLNKDSKSLLQASLAQGKPVNMQQFLSSSLNILHNQLIALEELNKPGVEEAHFIIINPVGGVLNFSYYGEKEQEFLVGDVPLQVVGIVKNRYYLKPVWGVNSELKPTKGELYNIADPLVDIQSKEQQPLIDAIQAMEDYSTKIGSDKGVLVMRHAQELKKMVNDFLQRGLTEELGQDDKIKFKQEFKVKLHSLDTVMAKHRKAWKPITANILIALTGVGFVLLFARLINTAIKSTNNGSPFSLREAGFFSETKTTQLARKVDDALDKLTVPLLKN